MLGFYNTPSVATYLISMNFLSSAAHIIGISAADSAFFFF